MVSTKLTKLEKYWILYDVGNSAFVLLVSTIIPIYFNHLAEMGGLSEIHYLAYWGYAVSISTVIVALIGPILGTIGDTQNYKKPLFTASVILGAASCAALSLSTSWMMFLAIFVLAKVGLGSSLVFYDSMIVDVTTKQKMDTVSTQGYAWGFIGSCIPFIISFALLLTYESLGISSLRNAATMVLLLNATWWMIVSLPLIKNYKQLHYIAMPAHPMKESFSRLFDTLKDIKGQKNIFMFLLAFFFFIDGVYTLSEVSSAAGTALGLKSASLLLALLVTQLIAFPSAFIFAKLAKKYPTDRLIGVCILAFAGISIFAFQLDKLWEFWTIALAVGVFVGAIQALSRSYFAKIIPPEKSSEYFGIYDIFGKSAAFLGTSVYAFSAQITGYVNAGMLPISFMFILGYFLFRKTVKMNQ